MGRISIDITETKVNLKTSVDSSVCHCRSCILNRDNIAPKGTKTGFYWGCGRCSMVYGSPEGHSLETDVGYICDIKIPWRAQLGEDV